MTLPPMKTPDSEKEYCEMIGACDNLVHLINSGLKDGITEDSDEIQQKITEIRNARAELVRGLKHTFGVVYSSPPTV